MDMMPEPNFATFATIGIKRSQVTLIPWEVRGVITLRKRVKSNSFATFARFGYNGLTALRNLDFAANLTVLCHRKSMRSYTAHCSFVSASCTALCHKFNRISIFSNMQVFLQEFGNNYFALAIKRSNHFRNLLFIWIGKRGVRNGVRIGFRPICLALF